MVDITKLKKRCRQLQLTGLPALVQLKAAQQNNDNESVERIANNIVEFLATQQPFRRDSQTGV